VGSLGYGANGVLGTTILMMGANARVADCLPLVGAILYGIIGTKRGTMGVIVLDLNTMLVSPAFKVFPTQRDI
jgi:hypothetical protein